MAIIQAALLATHLLAVNIASAGPLVCVWLHLRGRRGDRVAWQSGRALAKLSVWALIVGVLLGGVLLAVACAGANTGYWLAVTKIPASQVGFAFGELAFTAVCLLIYIATWDRWRDRPWVHGSLALLASTNLFYHFPPLMIVLGDLATRPELIGEELLTRPVYRRLMVRPEVLSKVAHFGLASFAVAGVALMHIVPRQLEQSSSGSKLSSRGGQIALAAAVMQLAVGVWVLIQLPTPSRNGLMGHDLPAAMMFLFSLLALFMLLQTLAASAFGDTTRATARRATLLLLTVVLLMVGTHIRAQQLEAGRDNRDENEGGARQAASRETALVESGERASTRQGANTQTGSREAMSPQVVEIVDRASGATARVLVSLGFNCFSWRPVLEDGPREMLRSEESFAEGDGRASGNGIPLLFPFPGRIGGTSYVFGGREYQLEPGDPFGNAIHGFVHTRAWRVVEQSAERVVGEFQASVDDPAILERWPADFLIRVSYEVKGRALISDVRYENTGASPLPCGFGTHAYFRLPLAEGSSAAETIVNVPVDRLWEAERMLPTGRQLPISENLSLSRGLRLDEHQFDTYFTGLKADADGFIRTRLTDPASGRVVTQTFASAFTQCVIYTPPHREAICLEPYTCAPDAIRLEGEGHETGLQILEPGAAFKTTLTIDVNR